VPHILLVIREGVLSEWNNFGGLYVIVN